MRHFDAAQGARRWPVWPSNIPHQKAVVSLGGVQSTEFSRVFPQEKAQLKLVV